MEKEEKGTERGMNWGIGGKGSNHSTNRSLNAPRRHTVGCGRSQNRKSSSEEGRKGKGPPRLTNFIKSQVPGKTNRANSGTNISYVTDTIS